MLNSTTSTVSHASGGISRVHTKYVLREILKANILYIYNYARVTHAHTRGKILRNGYPNIFRKSGKIKKNQNPKEYFLRKWSFLRVVKIFTELVLPVPFTSTVFVLVIFRPHHKSKFAEIATCSFLLPSQPLYLVVWIKNMRKNTIFCVNPVYFTQDAVYNKINGKGYKGWISRN